LWINSFVFILLSTIQLVSTTLILYFSYKYQDTCGFHAQIKKNKN
jgi:hypothetical protein